MRLVDRSILLLGTCLALVVGTAAGQPAAGNDHVVRPCQAQPYTNTDFYKPGIAPIDVLKAVRGQVGDAKAYVVHVAEWMDAPPPPATSGSTATPLRQGLTRSEWAGFNYKGEPKEVKTDSNGNPILFNKTSTALIGMTHFSNAILPNAVKVGYGYSTTPLPKQNLADLVALFNALAGAGGGPPKPLAAQAPPIGELYVATCIMQQDAPLPLSINLTYTVTPLTPPTPPPADLSPASLDFGALVVGSPKRLDVTLTNHQATSLTFAAARVITGPNAAEFSMTTSTCGPNLQAGANCKITVQFQPAAAGARAATLVIANDAPNSPQTVPLTGTGGVAPPPGPAAGGAPPPGAAGKAAKSKASGANASTAATSAGDQTSQGSSTASPSGATPTDCTAVTSDAPCTITRNVMDYDREYWDIGLGLAIPGVPERMYNPSDLTKKSTTTVHTDVYAFIDVYFTGNRNSPLPHLVLGVPTASQPVHRQAYAMAFPLTTWLGLSKSVPFTLCGLVGVAAVKEYHLIPDPNGINGLGLKAGWTGKWFYGVELPLNQLISRVSKIGK